MFANMKLGTKLSAVFVVLVLLSMLIGGVSYWGMSKMGKIMDDLGEHRMVKAETLGVVREAQTAIKAAERTLLVNGLDRALANRQLEEIKRAWDRADKAWAKFESLPIAETGKALWERQVSTWNAWKKDHQEFLRLNEEYIRSNNNPALLARMQEHALETEYRSFGESEKNLLETIAFNTKQSNLQMVAADGTEKTAENVMVGVLVFTLLFASAMGIMFVKNINKIVKDLLSEMDRLVSAAIAGKLETRGNVNTVNFEFQGIVEGVNRTLDAVIEPLNVAADYFDRISKGDIPPKITDSYNGDFNEIKNNLNRCIEAVNGLIVESVSLSRAAVEGRLQTRGKADKFEGSYRQIVQGFNDTLDAVLKPIEEAAECLKEISGGNLKVEVKGNYQGDHAIIKDALNGSIEAMNEILGQVSMAVAQVSAGSREIAASSQALSQGATESASAVEEISASMQQMGSQTNQNAENATQANQLAVMARDNAEKGNKQMTQMVKAMGDINQSANSISKIIKVIDEIAFQTNLLALNAAVEAARAGKHGKGFTVVAEEVRNLAQRSAKAAKETAEMIEDSIKRTEIGTAIAENTSKALDEIVAGSTKVTDLISEIAAASKEQAQGIRQISNGLGQVDQVTQQNTASAEQMASAGEELSSQSLQLKQMLAKFQLKKTARYQQSGDYGGSYSDDSYDAGQSMRQSASRQRLDVPWGGISAKAGRKNARGGEVKPEDIISLDDQHFGKF